MQFLVLLRGINVSGQKKIKMAELRNQLESVGFEKVVTYIQSGNIILESNLGSENKVEEVVKAMILKEYGWEVPALAMSKSYLGKCLNEYPFIDETEELQKRYFTFLNERPKNERLEVLNDYNFENEEYSIGDKCIFFHAGNGYGKAKMNNNFFENKLKVQATTRNWKTVTKLIELSSI